MVRLTTLPSTRLVIVAAVVLIAPAVWAATVTKRARPPQWNKRATDVFFSDAREKLVGERPAAGTGGGPTSAVITGDAAAPSGGGGGAFAWSNIISSDVIEAEVKTLSTQISKSVQTPAPFKGGGYKDARRSFSELAVLFAIIAEYDGDVRWKSSATGLRDLIGRAGFNCKVGTDQSYNEAKLRRDDLEKLMRGEAPQIEKGDAKAKWEKVSNRPPLMQRLEEAQRQGIAMWTASSGEFNKNSEKLTREAEVIAAIAEVIQREGFEYADDDSYLGYAKQMRDAAHSVVDAIKTKNFDQARKASGDLEKACNSCHGDFKSG